jgi:hypothetical protein
MVADFKILASAIGLTFIVNRSFLFASVRTLAKDKKECLYRLLVCPMCFSFWAYLICYGLELYGLGIINWCFISSLMAFLIYIYFADKLKKYD